MKKWGYAGGLILLFILGVLTDHYWPKDSSSSISQVRENSNRHSLINPLLLVDNSMVVFSDFDRLEDRVEEVIETEKEKGALFEASVYYRDLNTGKWAGVNEKDKYTPSSLLKVATLMAYLKIFQTKPEIMQQKVAYKPASDSGQHYRPSRLLPAGQYEVATLLREMIVYSENQAVYILNDLHVAEILEVYQDLKLPNPIDKENSDSDFMSPEDYSHLFRVLYNASYLSDASSETAIKLLTLTKFDKGLRAGLPEKTVVAHKFGERTKVIDNRTSEKQLHDCGIIYYPRHPYFLCVMTKGHEFPQLESVIAKISKIVYEEVGKNLKKK